jgi:hypothetical protein
MVGARQLRNDAVNRSDLDARPNVARSAIKHGTGRMCMRQDEKTAIAATLRDIPRIGGALMRFSATSRRLDDDECGV